MFNAPERDVDIIDVPGRNGSLILDNGRYKNISVIYPAFISKDFPQRAAAARNWLSAAFSYFRLEDTYYPEYFRMARFAGPMDFETRVQNWGAETNLVFDCKPQRFLKSGESAIYLENRSPGSLLYVFNPTDQIALPLVTIFGNGSFYMEVNDHYIAGDGLHEFVTIDCDLQDAYKDTINYNQNIFTNDFLSLPPGESQIYLSETISGISIIPRWWTI